MTAYLATRFYMPRNIITEVLLSEIYITRQLTCTIEMQLVFTNINIITHFKTNCTH